MGLKIWTDDPRGPASDIIPSNNAVSLGSAINPFLNLYVTNLISSTEVLANNTFLKSADATGTGTLSLLKGNATDNTVLNAKTGKVIDFSVNDVIIGSISATVATFPALVATTGTFSGIVQSPTFNLGDASDKNHSVTTYGSGTGYTVTATSAAVTLGTSSPTLVLDKAGTYIIFAKANYEFVGATFAANRQVTTKLRRTNNTAADVTASSTSFGTTIVTTVSGIAALIQLPVVVYTTANTNDIIVPFADVSVVPTAGSLQITESSIVAVRLY